VLGKRWGELDRSKSAFFRVEDRTDYRESSLGKRKGALLFPLEWNEEYWSAEQGRVEIPNSAPLSVRAAPEKGLEADGE